MQMQAKTEDRRIRRTKRLLRIGLAELMEEKDFKDITVKEIAERMDLNRGTFYLHYKDTYDLLEKVEDELIETFKTLILEYQPTTENISAFVIIDQIYDFITENYKICRILLQNNASTMFEDKLRDIITSKCLEINSRLYCGTQSKAMLYKTHFYAHGIMGLVKQWLADEMPIPKAEMVHLVDKIIAGAFLMEPTTA